MRLHGWPTKGKKKDRSKQFFLFRYDSFIKVNLAGLSWNYIGYICQIFEEHGWDLGKGQFDSVPKQCVSEHLDDE